MLDVLREIDGKRKDRTYFHQIPTKDEIKEPVKVVGKVLEKRLVNIFQGKELSQEKERMYRKVVTVVRYNPNNMFFNSVDQKEILKESFRDKRIKKVVKYIKSGRRFESDDEARSVSDKVIEMEEDLKNNGKVNEIVGKELVVLDDGINGIECLVDKELGIEEGKIYEVELSKSDYGSSEYLVVGGKEDYHIDKVMEI